MSNEDRNSAAIAIRDSIFKFHRSKNKSRSFKSLDSIQKSKSTKKFNSGDDEQLVTDGASVSSSGQFSLSSLSTYSTPFRQSVYNDISTINRDQKHYSFLLKSSNRIIFDDDTVSIGSSQMLFKDENLQSEDLYVPQQDDFDGNEYNRHRENLERIEKDRISKLQKRFSASPLAAMDRFGEVTINDYANKDMKTKGYVDRVYKLQSRRLQQESKIELQTIKAAIGNRYITNGKTRKELVHLRTSRNSTNSDIADEDDEDEEYNEAEDIVKADNHIAEVEMDLREETLERWCMKHHGRIPSTSYQNKDKRLLRKWFNQLDNDGSGEVSVNELLDPMLSSGILKTKAQVVRVLSNVDKNGTNGIDFHEFLQALDGNKFADKAKLKRLQDMSANPLGFGMETLLTEERRKKLIRSVMDQSIERQQQFDKVLNRFEKSRQYHRSKDRILVDFEKLDERHRRSFINHNTYVEALAEVVFDKLSSTANTDTRDEAAQAYTGGSTGTGTGTGTAEGVRVSTAEGLPPVGGMRFYSDVHKQNPFFKFAPLKKNVYSSSSSSSSSVASNN